MEQITFDLRVCEGGGSGVKDAVLATRGNFECGNVIKLRLKSLELKS